MTKILVVEDEKQIMSFLCRGLMYKGFEVISAANGNDAIKLAHDAAPDLVILDIMLPDFDGFEICRYLRIRTGKTLYHSSNLKSESFTLNQADTKTIQQGQNVFRTYQQDESQQVRTLTFPIWNHAHAIIAIAQVGSSLTSINEMQHVLLLFLGGGMLATALLAYVIGSVVANRELRPLSNLSSTLLDLSADGLGVRLAPTSSATEIQQLTDAFNQMTERLESSFQLQRHFIADISHKLRTPLTNIRGHIDILLMDQDLKADVYRDVRIINIELKRVSWLLTNLLLMARAEVGIVPEVSDIKSFECDVV